MGPEVQLQHLDPVSECPWRRGGREELGDALHVRSDERLHRVHRGQLPDQGASAGLGEAELQNKSGNFELPSQAAISAEAEGFAAQTPSSGTISMIYGPAADGYPIVNYEYAIVQAHQSSSRTAGAIQALLAWAIDPAGGNASTYLDQVNFVPLPTQVRNIAVNQLNKIS